MKTMAETWFLAKKRFGPAKTILIPVQNTAAEYSKIQIGDNFSDILHRN
jgi:hypothetical protein